MDRDQANALWKLEERFWLGSADFYAAHLAEHALMVLPPPAGMLNRQATIESIGAGARWRRVSFEGRHAVTASPTTAVLAYMAHAERDAPGSTYRAQCSSTYVHEQGQWRLLLHQQTPTAQTDADKG